MSEGVFIITDGTTSIDMLKTFCLVDWTPATPRVKGEGVWVSSPFTQGRQQVLREYDNVIENMTWVAKGHQSIDQLIRNTQDLRRLLEKASSYWLMEWQNEPVWIETRGICETNTRYGIIHDYRAPGDDNPFAPPFTTSGIFNDFALIMEHGIWQDAAPGSSNCVEISGHSQGWCYPHYLDFAATGSYIDCGSNAAVDDLPLADFTIDAWVLPNGETGPIVEKSNGVANQRLNFSISATNDLVFFADFDVTDAFSRGGSTGVWFSDGDWHHIAAVWNSTTKLADLYIDGVEITYNLHRAGANNYVTDAAYNLSLGGSLSGVTFSSRAKIGWLRISDNQRFVADFPDAIPPRCSLPNIDSNIIGLWIYEGTGATADNLEGTAALDGTITDATWDCDCSDGCGA